MSKKAELAKNLKDNFEAVAKLRERAKEVQRLLGVDNTALSEELRLAKELKRIFRAIKTVQGKRRKKLYDEA